MTHLQRSLIVLSILVTCSRLVCGEETEEGTKKTIEAPSPDGQFAFRYTGESDSDKKTYYNLITNASGKVLLSVAESDPDLGPSARFNMEVLWRPDSKAFALTATLWKRGSSVSVYAREGSTFREIKLPELVAVIPEKLKRGKSFPHVAELNSQSAKRWQKDGSLVLDIENMVDGNDGSITARRTVVLGLDRPGKVRVLKSTIKYETETDLDTEAQAALDKGDFNAAIADYNRAIKVDGGDFAAYYHRGCANFVKRDWTKALTDFQRHCDLRKEEEYQVFSARFYIWLIRARLGDREAADKELAPYMEGHPVEWSNGWDAKIGNFLLGRISEDDFFVSLSDNPGVAWFYAGMKRLLNNDRASAAEDFTKSVATGDKTADEYQLAAAELKALSK
jgi:tetratricopeptide (TPR) repeat protein